MKYAVTHPAYLDNIAANDFMEGVPPTDVERYFAHMMQLYSEKLFAIAYRITKNKSVAQDIVQETFLKLWAKQSSLVLKDTGSWLGKVAMNMALNHLKREKLKDRTLSALSYRKANEYYPDAEEQLIGKEKEQQFKKACAELPPQQRVVYHLSKSHDLSRYDIAQKLNISPNTVKFHLSKAVQFLKNNIGIASMLFLFWIFQIIFSACTSTNTSLDCLFNKEQQTVEKEQRKQLELLSIIHRL